jgi:hypothetical protein
MPISRMLANQPSQKLFAGFNHSIPTGCSSGYYEVGRDVDRFSIDILHTILCLFLEINVKFLFEIHIKTIILH